MSAQEDLEKLIQDVAERIAQCNAEDLPEQALTLAWVRDRIAAIREGLGKAQGEVVAWKFGGLVLLTEFDAKEIEALKRTSVRGTPLCECAAPPADSAQVVELKAENARMREALCQSVHEEQANSAQGLVEALEFYADPENYIPKKCDLGAAGYVNGKIHDYDRGEKAKTALDAHKSEVKKTCGNCLESDTCDAYDPIGGACDGHKSEVKG